MNEKLYMLRLWEGEDKEWHGSLKNMKTKEVRYFKTLGSLTRFLSGWIQGDQKPPEIFDVNEV
mgnify:FL=1